MGLRGAVSGPALQGYIFFLTCVCLFFKNKDLISSWGHSVGFRDWFHAVLLLWPSILAVLLEQGAVNSPSLPTAALEKALSCPVLWCLQGDKAFLSACPPLLLSGDFVEHRSCYGAVSIWGSIPVSIGARGTERCSAHGIPPSHLNGGGMSRWIHWMPYFQPIF